MNEPEPLITEVPPQPIQPSEAPPVQPPVEQPPVSPPPVVPPPPEPVESEQFAPKKGGSKIGLIVFILIFIFLIVPAGLIFATENNYLNLGLDKYYNQVGLEKLWNGLPKDGKLAMVEVNKKMDAAKSFHFNAKADVNVSLVQKKIPLAMLQNESGKVLGETTDSSQSVSVNFIGDYAKPSQFSAKLVLKLGETLMQSYGISGTEISLDTIYKENSIYIKIPEELTSFPSAGKYIQIEQSQYQTQAADWQPEALQKKLEKAIKSSERLSSASLNGIKLYHFQFVIDKNKIESDDISAEALTQNPKIDVYVGKKDHLIYKISTDLDMEDTSSTIKFSLVFSDYNKAVSVQKPADDEIAEGGIENLIYGTVNSESPGVFDAQRKGHLATVKTALEKYKEDNGEYPVSTEIDKTNNNSGVLAKSLVPKYLDVLPVDAKNPTWWYGYTGDGSTFKLWCLLENKSDSQGTQDGQYFKYIVTND